jgi:hypothetical protein
LSVVTGTKKTRRRLKEINLGKGNEAIPPKPPKGDGHDLTEFVGQTAEAKVKITITNNGKEPLAFSCRLFFATKVIGLSGLVMVQDSDDGVDVTIDPGEAVREFLSASLPIEAISAATGGRCDFYTVLAITADNEKKGKEFQCYAVLATTTAPWYIKKQDAKRK